jgi:hypothetical protein
VRGGDHGWFRGGTGGKRTVIRNNVNNNNNNWSHWYSNEKLKEKFGSCTRKTIDRFTTKDSYTWNITHKTESTPV